MKHQHCTITDRERISANIEVLNKTMQEENEKDLRNKERTAIKKIKEEPKYFYKYANQNRKTRSRIGPLKSGEFYYSGEKEMAKILSDQYKSVFSPPKEEYSTLQLPTRNITHIADLALIEVMFKEAMKEVNPTSAPGPDGVPA